MALGPQSARDRQEAVKDSLARAPRQYFTRAGAAADIANLVDGQILYAAGRRYRVDATGPDGLVLVDRTWAGAFEQLQSQMQDGQTIRFACYGDSTTDGSQTTDWTPNPTNGDGDAIGNAAHNPPFAWPTALRNIIRSMYGNSNIQIWNAGYGGKTLVDGWAVRNFRAAVIDNPAYGTPNACLINFGLNDHTTAVYSPGEFFNQLVLLLNLMDFYGVVPVFVQPDPVIQGTQRQGGDLSEIMSVYERAAGQFGVKVIDAHSALLDVFSSGGTNNLWTLRQADGLHFSDGGHRVKASFVAAHLFNKTLFVDRGTENLNIASFGKHANTQELSYGVFDQANNRFGACLNVTAGSYTPGQILVDVWVWCVSDEMDAYWRSTSGDGYYRPRPLASAPEIEVGDYLQGTITTIKSPTAGQVVQTPPDRDAEAPGFIAALTSGLTRLAFKAPSDNNTSVVFLGYFQLKRTRLPVTVSTFWPLGGEGNNVYDPGVYEGREALVGFGYSRSVRMLIDMAVPEGAGVFLWLGRVFTDGTGGTSIRRRGFALVRNGANIQLLNVAVNNVAVSAPILATAAYSWDEGSHEFTVRASVTDGNYSIQITPAQTPLSPVIAFTSPITAEPMSMGGHFGALYKSYNVSPAAGRARCTLLELLQA